MPHHDLQVGPVLRRLYWLAGAALVALSLTAVLTYQADRRNERLVVSAFNRARLSRDVQALALERQHRIQSFFLQQDAALEASDKEDRSTLFAKLDSLTKADLTPAETSTLQGLRADLTTWDSIVARAYDSGTIDAARVAHGLTLFQKVRDDFKEVRGKEDEAFAVAANGNPWLRRTWVGSLVLEFVLIVVGVLFTYRMILHDVGAVMESQVEVLDRLAAAGEYRDDDTGRHTQRVGELAARIARAMGVEEAQAMTIRRAAALHDVGKIGVPDEVLLKQGKLTPEESQVMRQHTIIGAQILQGGHSAVVSTAARIARSHHERWDGAGYPDRLSGNAIPFEARITAVADVFDAIRSKRPYRDAWALEVSLEEIRRSAGTQFDPDVVKAFFDGRCYEGYAVEGGESQDAESRPLLVCQVAKLSTRGAEYPRAETPSFAALRSS